MSKAKEYNYTPNDVEVLSKAQDALANLKLLLKKGSILHSDELLIKFYYQCLGNCLKQLPLALIEADLELKPLIFWARAENRDKSRHLFDRMDTAHEADILNFIRDSIAGSVDIWLAECEALSSLIKQKHQIVGCPIVADCESFNLATEALPQFHKGNRTEECAGNILRALAVIDSIGASSGVLPTLPNMIIIIMANQVIGNNFNRLLELGCVLGDEALIRAVVDRRNSIAHATTFDPSITPSYFFKEYVRLHDVRELIEPLASALTMVAAAEDVPPPEAAASSTPLESDNDLGLVSRYKKNHQFLFGLLQRAGITDVVEPQFDGEGKIFSDTELLYIVFISAIKRDFKLFTNILDGLRFFTGANVKTLINTPILCNASRVVGIKPESKMPADRMVEYLPEEQSKYFALTFPRCYSSAKCKEGAFPSIRFLYLLEYALSLGNWEPSIFVNKLLALGANPNTECLGVLGGISFLLPVVLIAGKINAVHLLLSYGADPNAVDSAAETEGTALCLAARLPSPSNVTIVRTLVNYGADPRKETEVSKGLKMHLVGAIMTLLNDDDAYEVSRVIINLMADKYGFESIKTMLKSTCSITHALDVQSLSLAKKLAVLEGLKVRNKSSKSKRSAVCSDNIKVMSIAMLINSDENKYKCRKLINLLIGLNELKGHCELFKIVLTDNLEAIKTFVEKHSVQEQHSLLSDKFTYTAIKGDAPVEIGIYEFAKIFCSKEAQTYLLTLQVTLVKHRRNIGKAAAASVDGGDSKDDDAPQPPLGLAAGLVSAQPQQRRSSTVLQGIPPSPNANIVEVDVLAASFAGRDHVQEGKEHFSR